jgi:nucleoside-diphosphate-sugar epimerase
MTKAAEGSMLNDRPRPWACTKLARSLLDWSTQTSLDDGLSQTIAFVENQRDMYDNAYCANG